MKTIFPFRNRKERREKKNIQKNPFQTIRCKFRFGIGPQCLVKMKLPREIGEDEKKKTTSNDEKHEKNGEKKNNVARIHTLY